MKFKIVSDSSADLKMLEGVDFASVPLKIITDEKEYVDDENLDIAVMVNELKAYKGRSGSSCPNASEWEEAFGDADYIFAITITSSLSGSFNTAVAAKINYEGTHFGRHVYVIDSLSTGPEMQLIIEKLVEMIESGMAYEDICRAIHEYQRTTQLFFSLESMSNLAKNGRVSKAVAAIAGVLGIRMLGRANEHGVIEPMVKCRGELKTLNAILVQMKARGYKGGRIIISHCLNERAALRLKSMMTAEFGDVSIGIRPAGALCSFYAEMGGLLIGFES